MRLLHSAFRTSSYIALAILAAVARLPAQQAQLQVSVLDASGAAIPTAQVAAIAASTGWQTSGLAGPDGKATLQLSPDRYTLTVSAFGFQTWRRKELNLSSQLSLDVTLSVSSSGCGPCVTPELPPFEVGTLSLASEISYIAPKRPFLLRTAYEAGSPAEVVLIHGTILTGAGLKQGLPQIVSAMAVADGKVLAIGTDAEIERLAGAHTLRRDLHGAFLMPGLNDAHVHLGGAGQTKLNVDLTGSQSLAEMLARVKAKAAASPAGHWLTGGGWDHTLWASKTLPTRQDLDQAAGSHPALLERIDGHIAVANTAALKAAGIDGHSKAPQGGAIDLDAAGEPTGIVRDTAMEQFEKLIPPPNAEDRRRGLMLAIQDAVLHGLTSVQDNSDWEDFLVFESLESEGKLPLRITEWLPFAAPLDELKAHRAHHDGGDPLLHTGMLKGFMDGSLGSRTAAMKAPYADDPKNSGLPRYDQAKLDRMAAERAQAGFQIGFHAIGDRAASMALEAFAQPMPGAGAPSFASLARGETASVATGHRDRIEHSQVVDPTDIPRYAKLGVIASMQPNHLLTDMNWAVERLGPKRAQYSYAWKAFLDAGVVLAFGTDYPVEPVTPFRGLYAAVTRANEAGTKTYFPENALTRAQALYAYTQGSAYAEFAEDRKGQLAPGYEADYVILDRNLLTCPDPEILRTKVLETVVGGRTVYEVAP